MTESGQSKDSASLDENVESPSRQMKRATAVVGQRSRSWVGSIGRFFLICLYIGFLTAVVVGILGGTRILRISEDKSFSFRRSVQEPRYGPGAPEFAKSGA